MSAKSRSKGQRGERDVIRMLRDNLGIACNRQLKQYQQGQHGDIEQIIAGYCIEVKNQKKISLATWWAQALAAADKAEALPCLVYKAGVGKWRFVVPIESAWATGTQWSRDIRFTQELHPEGFYHHCREKGL